MLNQEDQVVIQDRTREYFGGINNSLSYKGISLQFLVQFVKQEGSFTSLFNSGFPENQLQEFSSTSTTDHQISQTPEASLAYSRVVESDLVIEDASFIRLKTLNLSYSLPADWISALGISQAKFFMTGQNLWTLTDYRGMDPDTPIGGLAFSGLRTFTTGLQVNF